MKVRVRFAPSPTGYLHIGGARTALFNWLFARRHEGAFILRIEDTDQKRLVPDSLDDIMASLRWLGLDWDEGPDVGGDYGPYVQSERAALYQEWGQWLLDNDKAYKCFCGPEDLAAMRKQQMADKARLGYDRRCRSLSAETVAAREAAGETTVIRFKAPIDGTTTFTDAIRGEITYNNEQLNDQVLLKSDGLPTYHLANVVDDHFMEISHIMRADEWINSAPLHIRLYEAFGWDAPVLAHLPVVLSPSGKGKLSKRDQAFQDGDVQVLVQVRDYEANGYLTEAVTNFLANVGWAFGDDVEKFTLAEAAPRFAIDAISPASTRLPYSKLEWLNGQYIQAMDNLELAKALKPFLEADGHEVNVDSLLAIIEPLKVRLKRLTDAGPQVAFLFDDENWAPDPTRIAHKKIGDMPSALAAAYEYVGTCEPFSAEKLGDGLRAIGERAADNGKAGPFLGTLRYGITGQPVSPPLFESMVALGRERSLDRLKSLLALIL